MQFYVELPDLIQNKSDLLNFFLYLYIKYISDTEWLWIGFGLVLVPLLF